MAVPVVVPVNNLLPVLVLGLFSLYLENLSLLVLRHQVEDVQPVAPQ